MHGTSHEHGLAPTRHRRPPLRMPAAALAATIGLAWTGAAGAQDTLNTSLRSLYYELLIQDILDAAMSAKAEAALNQIEFDEAEIFFEENTTDGDLGIQFFFDAEGWDRTWIVTPGGDRLVDVKVKGNAGEIGLTEIMSESEEPSFDELPRDEFLALFEAGTYCFYGRTVEGDWLVGEAELTFDMPEPVEILFPEEEAEVPADEPLEIKWTTVADPNAPDSVIEAYQIIVEKDEEEERLRVWTVDMLPTDSCVTLPVGFLEPGRAYKVEIIAVETGNNKTITEREFETEEEELAAKTLRQDMRQLRSRTPRH